MVMNVTMPHDAAAAEQMVLQQVKNQLPDHIQYDDILTKQLYRDIEMARVSIDPPTEITPIFDKRILEDKSRFYGRAINKNQRERQNLSPPQEQRRPREEKYFQPFLFDMDSEDSIPEEYTETTEEEMGHHLDIRY